jgi:transcriptional regulator with XRE-family HTH domain
MSRDEWVVFDPASLGAALGHFRERAGLTQEALARKAGLHRPYLSHLERRKATAQTVGDAIMQAIDRLTRFPAWRAADAYRGRASCP